MSPTVIPGTPTVSPTGSPADGKISGKVTDPEGTPLPGAMITLKDNNGVVIAMTMTRSDGTYKFTGVPLGDYTIEEVNPPGYPGDGSPNTIKVIVTPGEGDKNNNFIDTLSPSRAPTKSPTATARASPTMSPTVIPGTPTVSLTGSPADGKISGKVTDPEGTPLPGAMITLKDNNGVVITMTTTGSDGTFKFTGVPPGDYTIKEVNPPRYPGDGSPNTIKVIVTPGEDDKGNKFIDTLSPSGAPTKSPNNAPTFSPVTVPAVPVGVSPSPSDSPSELPSVGLTACISSMVKASAGTLLENVLITLRGEGIEKTTMTDVDGYYEFTELEKGVYTVVETNPLEYPDNESDPDKSNDGDVADNNTTVDNNKIGVTLLAGEHDADNDFVDTRTPSGGPTKSPTASPTASASSPVAIPAVPDPTESPTHTPAVNNTAMISGLVKADDGTLLIDVLITLLANGTKIMTTMTTNVEGYNEFTDLEKGEYTVVETNPHENPDNVSNQDNLNDGDVAHGT